MNTSGLPVRNALGMFRLIRFVAGSLVILTLLSVYCLNVSHRWEEGLGALPNEHVNWLPASAFRPGSVESLGVAVTLLAACGLTMTLRRRQAEVLLSAMTALAAVTSLAVIGQRLSPRQFAVFDLTGFFPYENHFAAFANLLFPVALCIGERWRIRAFQSGKISSPSGLFFCAAGLMIAAVALSGSRAGLLISGLISGAWMLLQIRLHRRYPQIAFPHSRRVWQGALLAAALALVAGLIYWVNQVRQVGEELNFRGQVLADTVAMGLDNPFWGSGPGSFSAVFPYYQSLPVDEYFFRHAHCEPLQFFAEYGLLGCLLLTASVALIIFSRRSRRGANEPAPTFRELEGGGLMLALAGIALHSLIDFPFRHLLIALLTVAWVGILAGNSSDRQTPPERKKNR